MTQNKSNSKATTIYAIIWFYRQSWECKLPAVKGFFATKLFKMANVHYQFNW